MFEMLLYCKLHELLLKIWEKLHSLKLITIKICHRSEFLWSIHGLPFGKLWYTMLYFCLVSLTGSSDKLEVLSGIFV